MKKFSLHKKLFLFDSLRRLSTLASSPFALGMATYEIVHFEFKPPEQTDRYLKYISHASSFTNTPKALLVPNTSQSSVELSTQRHQTIPIIPPSSLQNLEGLINFARAYGGKDNVSLFEYI